MGMFYRSPKVGQWQGNAEEMLAIEYEEGESESLSHRISQGLCIPNNYVSSSFNSKFPDPRSE